MIATVVVSQFWEAGTLFFTALVPITVAIVSEVLKRPAAKLTEVAPLVVPPLRRSDRTEERDSAFTDRTEERDSVFDDPPPSPVDEPGGDRPARAGGREDDPFGLYGPERRSALSGRVLRVGLITGLLAFLIAAAFVTASELALFDNSIGSPDRRTTLVGGASKKSSKRDAKETPTPAPADATPGATPTATPGKTATPDAKATPSATPSVSPTPSATPGETPTATPAPGAAAAP